MIEKTWAPGGPGVQPRAVFEATVADTHGVTFWSHGLDEPTEKRALGSMYLMFMPDPGLDEAVESLREIWDFHFRRAQLGAPEVIQPETGSGRVVETVERPVLALES